MAKKSQKNTINALFLSLICLIVGSLSTFYALTYLNLPLSEDVFVTEEVYFSKDNPNQPENQLTLDATGEVSIHFLELGNKYTGDCTYIKSGDIDILIDCGSKASSISTVSSYLNQYVTDNILEYVIVTHAHQDHYAGFATTTKISSIFDLYQCENIITFSATNQKRSESYVNNKIISYATTTTESANLYNNFMRELNAEIENGATHYIATECLNSPFDIGNGATLKILNNHYYTNEAHSENDYSVCCLITHGERNFLFTGDLEEEGEEYLVELNSLPQVELYKAGHHGSKTSSSVALMQVVRPKHVCVCCCAGSSEYTDVNVNQFPTQIFINNIAPYTQKIYVTTLCLDYSKNLFTSMNGNIVCLSTQTNFEVKCSNNNIILKETEWFKQNRTWPQSN